MYVYTTIATENDAIHLTASLEGGIYSNPALSFYSIVENWRRTYDPVVEVWDNGTYLVDELYTEVVKYCAMGMSPVHFDPGLQSLLEGAKCSLEELKELLTGALKLGFFNTTECNFFAQ